MQSRFRPWRREKQEVRYAMTIGGVRETGSEAGRSQSTRPTRDRARSFGSVAVDVHGVAEILNERQLFGREHGRIRGIVMEIRDYKMFLCAGLDDGRGEGVLGEIELGQRLRVIGGGVGNVNQHGTLGLG